MDLNVVFNGLIMYLGLVVLLTFHEYGHAWMAWKCGDTTAKDLGRCSLNPLVHIDLIGTVILPLMAIFLSMTGSALAGFLIGWAKPVPVNQANLRNPKLDDILVSLAGPWMNVMLAVLLIGLAKVSLLAGVPQMVGFCQMAAQLSLLLCFFNLIPVPPLDGSHVVRVLSGMSNHMYYQIARFGFIIVILLLQVRAVRETLGLVTLTSYRVIQGWFGL